MAASRPRVRPSHTPASDPSPGSTGSASTSPTRSCRCGTPSRSRPAIPMPPCRTGRSPGAAGSRSRATSRSIPRPWPAGRVFDLASGSGLCAIAAARAGARAVVGVRHRRVRPAPRSRSTPRQTASGSTVAAGTSSTTSRPTSRSSSPATSAMRPTFAGRGRRLAAARARARDRRAPRRSRPALPAARRARRARDLRGPDDDRARGPRAQARLGLRGRELGADRRRQATSGATSVASRVIDSSSYGFGKPAIRWW